MEPAFGHSISSFVARSISIKAYFFCMCRYRIAYFPYVKQTYTYACDSFLQDVILHLFTLPQDSAAHKQRL
jgi:hypothetical protein